MADGEARGPTGKASVGDQRASLAQTLGLEIAGRIEHLLHAGATLGSLVADQYHLTWLHQVIEDRRHCRLLAFEDSRRAGESQNGLVHPRRLNDTTVLGEVTEKYCQPTVGAVGMGLVANAASLTIQVETGPLTRLAEGDLGGHAPGGGQIALPRLLGPRADDVPSPQGLA